MYNRVMKKGNAKLKVIAHVILKNFWEYYVTESPDDDGVMWALVVGDAIEYGTVSQYDIDKHGISYTTDLDDLEPAPGWEWEKSATDSTMDDIMERYSDENETTARNTSCQRNTESRESKKERAG